jgi:hypothetical protein
VAFYAPLPPTGVTLGLHHFLFERLQIWSHILLFWDLSPSAPNFKKTIIVVIKQGGICKAVIDSVNKRIDSIINLRSFLVIYSYPEGEIVKKQLYHNNNLIGLRGKDLKCLNWRFVSWRGASRRVGIDVSWQGSKSWLHSFEK